MPNKTKSKLMSAMAVALIFVFSIIPNGYSAEAQQGENTGGFASGLSNAISDFQAKLPAMFREPSPEDFGNKPRVKTHFGASSSFTTDADLTNKNSEPAWLARVASGLTVEMPIGDRLYTELDYTFSYATAQGRRVSENTVSHNLRALGRYKLTDATTLGLKQGIQWSQVPGDIDDFFTLSTTTAEVNHAFSDILTGDLYDTFSWFQDESANDEGALNQEYVDNTIGGSIGYDVTERVRLTPSVAWGVRDFSQVDDKDYWNLVYMMAGAYELGPQTTIRANIGHNIRQFAEGGDDSDHAIVYGLSVENSISRKLAWSLSYARNVVDTFDTGFVNSDSAEATNLDNLDRNFRVMRSNRFGAGLSYNMSERHTFALSGALQFTETNAEDNVVRLTENDETTTEFGPSYSYRLNKYLSLDLRYTFGRRFSNDDAPASGRENYTFHKIGGGLTVNV